MRMINPTIVVTNQGDRMSRKHRIRHSIKMAQHNFLMSLDNNNNNKSDHYLPLQLQINKKKKKKKTDEKTDETSKRRNRKTDMIEICDTNGEDSVPLLTKEAKKKKRSKKTKQRSKALGVVIIPDCENEDLFQFGEQAYDFSPHDSVCTNVTFLMDDDDCYLSDITDEDEPCAKKSPKKLARERTKETTRPKSERNIEDRDSKTFRRKRSTHSRSLDPAPRLHRPRCSLEKSVQTKKTQRTGNRSRRKGDKSTRSSTRKLHCSSVVSNESPSSHSGRVESMRSLRRPSMEIGKQPPRKGTKSKSQRHRRTVAGEESKQSGSQRRRD